MKAELHNKISSTGSNLNDRLEDQLTGDVFGTLTYIPFEKGLLKLLLSTKEIKDISTFINNLNWQNTKIIFWKRFEGCEPDILLVSESTVILIEVKYKSGLSSDDGADFSGEDIDIKEEREKDTDYSSHQLRREALILIENFTEKKNKLLILVADEIACSNIFLNTTNRNLIHTSVHFGYISWQNVLETLISNDIKDPYPCQNIISDIIDLLIKKGFERFKSFSCSDVIRNENLWEFDSKQNKSFEFCATLDVKKEFYYEY